MADFIFSLMSSKTQHFNVKCRFNFNGREIHTRAILDTGCSKSLLSADLIYSIESLKTRHIQDIKLGLSNDIEMIQSYSVDTIGNKVARPNSIAEAINDRSLRFAKEVSSLEIQDYALGDIRLYVSYNHSKILLLGMDIIKTLECFIGSRNDNFTYFIGVRRGEIDAKGIMDTLMYKRDYKNGSKNQEGYADLIDGILEANYINKIIQSK